MSWHIWQLENLRIHIWKDEIANLVNLVKKSILCIEPIISNHTIHRWSLSWFSFHLSTSQFQPTNRCPPLAIFICPKQPILATTPFQPTPLKLKSRWVHRPPSLLVMSAPSSGLEFSSAGEVFLNQFIGSKSIDLDFVFFVFNYEQRCRN